MACPPSRVIPVSNDTRVRSDGFWNSMPSVRPASGAAAW